VSHHAADNTSKAPEAGHQDNGSNNGFSVVAHALAKLGIKHMYGVVGIPVTELASAAQVHHPLLTCLPRLWHAASPAYMHAACWLVSFAALQNNLQACLVCSWLVLLHKPTFWMLACISWRTPATILAGLDSAARPDWWHASHLSARICCCLQAVGIRFIGFRNEQAAGYAAAACGYLTGVPGVLLTVSGPGAVHGIAGLSHAGINCWPMIMLSGSSEQVSSSRLL